MTNFDLDKCLKIIPNKYELILLAKTRTDEIISGSSILTQKSANEKNFVSALNEISEGFHDYYSLNEKTMTKIRNEISGVSVQIQKDKNSNDKFDEDSLFAQIFQNFDQTKSTESTVGLNDFNIENNEIVEKDSDDSDVEKLDFS
jgi:DNA-directed RNA polymerase omega subunit